MKKTVLGLFLIFAWNAFAWADVPKYISFQGELTDSQGARITTSKTVTFTLYKSSGGTTDSVWSEVHSSVTPSNGIVSVSLGSQTAGGIAADFKSQYWLGVKVSPDANEMTPRVILTTSPYAFIAKFLDTGATAYGALTVSETVTANKFVGDGSMLTGIAGGGSMDTDWTIATASTIYKLNGYVGIGTASPGDSLVVVGGIISDTLTVGDTFLVVRKSGKVGIGTANPMHPLHVAGYMELSAPADDAVVFRRHSAADLFDIDYNGMSNGSGSTSATNGRLIRFEKRDGTGIQFWTRAAGVAYPSGTEHARMVITEAGTVGIGTTNPGDSLHVAGRILMDVNSAASATDGAIRWTGSDFEGRKVGSWVSLTATGGGSPQPDTDWTVDGLGNVYRTTGNVGIATTTPSDSLTVNGSLSVDSPTLYVDATADYVSIGTSSVPGKLTVAATGAYGANHLILKRTDAGNANASMRWMSSAGAYKAGIGSNFNVTDDANLEFLNNATTNMILTSAGNVGIGTTSPSDKLHVNGKTHLADTLLVGVTGNDIAAFTTTSSWGELQLRSPSITGMVQAGMGYVDLGSRTPGSVNLVTNALARITIDTSGKVGIGTQTPGDSLVVKGAVVADSMTVNGTVTATAFSGSGAALTGVTASGVSPANLTSAVGTDSIANGAVTSAKLTGSVNVTDSLVVGDTRFVVLKSGYVGLGTASPSTNLHLYANGTTTAHPLILENAAPTNYTQLKFLGTGRNFSMGVGNGSEVSYGVANKLFVFDGTAGSMRMVMDITGNVGIGTTTPGGKLHVAGNVIVRDTFVVQDTMLVVKESGNVGIGTSGPNNKLHVTGGATFSAPGTFPGDANTMVDQGGLRVQHDAATPDATATGVSVSINRVNPAIYTENVNGPAAIFNGKVGIGTTNPDTDLSVNGGASKVGGGSWATFSDGRLKNIDGEFKAGTAALMKLNPVKYRYRADNPVGIRDGAEHIGLVAQEVKEAIPEAVESNNKGYLMLNNDPIIFAMLNAIKEQQQTIRHLEGRIAELEMNGSAK